MSSSIINRSFKSIVVSPTPSKEQVDDLQYIKLVNVSPNSGPQATFLRFPNEDCNKRVSYPEKDFTATKDINIIQNLRDEIMKLENLINEFYSRRSIMAPLKNHFKNLSQENMTKMGELAFENATKLLNFLFDAMNSVEEIVDDVVKIFNNSTNWKEGWYSEELLNYLMMIIYKLICFDRLKSVKKLLLFDLNELCALFNQNGKCDTVEPKLKKWLNEMDAIQNLMASKIGFVKEINLPLMIIYRYIRDSIQTVHLFNETKYAYLVSFAFLIKLYPSMIQPQDIHMIQIYFQKTPYVPLVYEFSMNIISYLRGTILFKENEEIIPLIDLNSIYQDIRVKFSDIFTRLQNEIAMEQRVEKSSHMAILETITEALQIISSTTNLLLEQYSSKLENPPSEPSSMKPYERSVRKQYSQSELKIMLQLLAHCRELHDYIRNNIPIIYQKICSSIQLSFQEFIKNTLEKIALKAKKNKDSFRDVINKIRVIAGDWMQNESIVISKKSEFKKHDMHVRTAAPYPQLIELVRIQMQHITNPESKYLQSPKNFIQKVYTPSKEYEFLKISKYWTSLINFDHTLEIVIDQSSFYLKEVQLDLNQVVQFPVRSSLPFILCQFALDNYDQPDITEIIFYPLSIYDDAAYTAIHKLKSRLIFDEISAEANVCLDTLSVLIGEFTFNSFKAFAALRYLPEEMSKKLKINHARHWPKSQAYRLRTLLHQNQFSLLSKQVPFKSLIAPRIDSELNNFVSKLFDMSKDLGIVASIAIKRMMEIILETHHLLVEQGIPLMPFKDIENSAQWNNHIESFSSKYLHNVSQHIFRNVIQKFVLAINPIRLIPHKKLQISADSLSKLHLGKLLKEALDTSFDFITINHFSAFFDQISNGSILIFCKGFQSQIPKLISHFIQKYKNIYNKLIRINDPHFGTSIYEAFSKYEHAYKYLINDPDFIALLSSMQRIGNTFAIAELIDQSLSMKDFYSSQTLNYLKGIDENGIQHREIEKLFDKEFQDSIKMILNRTKLNGNVQQLHLEMIINKFASYINNEKELFAETNQDYSDYTQFKGFASVWSIIEFSYCLMESNREPSESSGFQKYGQGVFICAGLIISLIGQEKIYNLIGICRKLQRFRHSDMSGVTNEKIVQYLAVTKYCTSAVYWAIMSYKNILQK